MYKGREGQWAFFLHRFSGLAILLYLMIHVFSIGSAAISEQFYNTIHGVYKSPIFSLSLVLVASGVLYHALNGLRIIAMDMFGWGIKLQRELWYVTMFLTVLGGLLTLVLTGMRILSGGEA